uniref:Uncharacterized protein n=1 Tax=uncultured marine microorganism HF4000_APKG7H23 TaxID=455551 RepID=B3T9T8_9ZZZZ|nr:hypothetical protein ALOHA_HF4000APKG7H23ctg3g12 [uncultured marine microorganism HF4000_APKG7H23]
MGHVANAPRGDERGAALPCTHHLQPLGVAHQGAHGLEVRSRKGAIAGDGGIDEPADSCLRHGGHQITDTNGRALGPPLDRHQAVACIQGRDHALWAIPGHGRRNELGRGHDGCSQDHPVCAHGDDFVHGLQCPEAATDLERHPYLPRDLLVDEGVLRRARLGTV